MRIQTISQLRSPVAAVALFGLLWAFEGDVLKHYSPAADDSLASASVITTRHASAINWPDSDWPSVQPFLLAQEVREVFRHTDAKRDAGTPVRDIAALPRDKSAVDS